MDLAGMLRRAIAEFGDRVQQIRSDQCKAPTPCDEWDAQTLVGHPVAQNLWAAPLYAGATPADVGDRVDVGAHADTQTRLLAAFGRHAARP